MIDPRGTLSRSFWLSPVDPRPLAALRILFGSILLFQLIDLWPDVDAFFTDLGVMPHEPLSPESFGVLWWFGDSLSVKCVLGVYGIALVAYTLGFHSRIASLVSWLLCVSWHHRMGGILTGGDYLAQLFLFISIFADVGACWSLDARRRGAVRRQVSPVALRCMQVLLALLYLITARLKQKGSWASGEGIRLSLEMFHFTRPLGAWLHAHPDLCQFMTFVILGLEYLYPFLAMSPIRTRQCQLGAAAVGLIIQGGILTMMRVGPFTWFMLATTVLFIPSDLWDRVLPLGGAPEAEEDARFRGHSSPVWTRISALVLVLVTLINVESALLGSRLPPPEFVRSGQVALGLALAYGLFDNVYDVSWYEVITTSADGKTRDIVPQVAPSLGEGKVGWLFSPWVKAAYGLYKHPAEQLAGFFCRAHRDTLGPDLPTHLKLVRHHYVQVLRRSPPAPRETQVLWDGPCPSPALAAR